MPKKVTTNYWANFLRSKNLIGVVTADMEAPAAASQPARSPPSIDPDMETFITRVVETLIPVHADYSAQAKASLLANRKKYREGLLNVLNGRGSLERWFNRTRNELGLHAITLTKILYESLKGLRNKDARMLRAQFGETLSTMSQIYQVR